MITGRVWSRITSNVWTGIYLIVILNAKLVFAWNVILKIHCKLIEI